MQLEVGKKYINRCGDKVTITSMDKAATMAGGEDYHYPYWDNNNEAYTREGTYYDDGTESQLDLIAPWEEATLGSKDTNPKDAVGIKKPAMSTVSAFVLQEVGVAMMEGARKYGRHNYRVAGVRASVYYDAALRHLMAYWEGEDTDPDSGISHLSKAIAGLIILRDSEINGIMVDDRPPVVDLTEQNARLQEIVDNLFVKHPVASPSYLEKDKNNLTKE